MTSTVLLQREGLVPYRVAWQRQREAAATVRDGTSPERLVLLQHLPVYTLGRRTRPESLLFGAERLQALGADVVEVDRGGDITFHGPGQVVGYPILHLRKRGLGPVGYVRGLEAVVIDALRGFGVDGERVPGRPGVWTATGKICSIGVRVQGGVTTHGFALNVDPDLSWFGYIIPCGLQGITVTSMAAILGQAPALPDVETAVARAFERVFDVSLEAGTSARGATGFPPSTEAGDMSPWSGAWDLGSPWQPAPAATVEAASAGLENRS